MISGRKERDGDSDRKRGKRKKRITNRTKSRENMMVMIIEKRN